MKKACIYKELTPKLLPNLDFYNALAKLKYA